MSAAESNRVDLSQATLEAGSAKIQLTTFSVAHEVYGVEVMRVQEVTANPKVIPVPLAPPFILGMINLRGQIATALSLRALFGHPEVDRAAAGESSSGDSPERMSVVCKLEGNLVSLIVDSIGEVVEVEASQFEELPGTVSVSSRKLLKNICKLDHLLLSILDLDKLTQELAQSILVLEEKKVSQISPTL